MSAAQELRDAAERLRTLAEAATPGPWEADGDRVWGDSGDVLVALTDVVSDEDPDIALIAAMHPGVALALADWLNYVVAVGEPGRANGLTGEPYDFAQALAVARAINGGAS